MDVLVELGVGGVTYGRYRYHVVASTVLAVSVMVKFVFYVPHAVYCCAFMRCQTANCVPIVRKNDAYLYKITLPVVIEFIEYNFFIRARILVSEHFRMLG